ncbi:MAG TPA: hypothetical protein VLE73_05030 [Candidatus Saccharimonadales bacterium]|nr:hypothetical protein [Candidatus Saccharimonadales bacterium]
MTHTIFAHLQLLAQSIDITDLPKPAADSDRLALIFNIVLTFMGATGLLIVTLAGVRYMTSRGNPQAAAKAKDAILFTLIGLVIIAMGFVIVNFVVTRIG